MAYRDAEVRKAHIRADYQKNRSARITQIHERQKALRDWIRTLKLKCARCPESDQVCLDFHHRNPAEKDVSIADTYLRGWSKERILHEIEKCDVLCANCHRKLHELERATGIEPALFLVGSQMP